MRSAKEIQALLEEGIKRIDVPSVPKNLYDPIHYILSLGGKRIRPVLSMLFHQIREKDLSNALPAVFAIEVFHNFSLMHDDIMDQAPIRRGQPTVHEKWNEPIAILSGDVMLVRAYELLISSKSVDIGMVRRFNDTAREVCEGQQMDMDFENKKTVTESEYLEMIRLKTAVLFGFSVELGGLLSGVDAKTAKGYFELGEALGMAFQLTDDYLDVYGDPEKFGKQVGGDIVVNKKTYLLISALELANEDQKRALDNWLNLKEFDPMEKVQAIKEIFDEIGIPNLVKMKIDYFINLWKNRLDLLNLPEKDVTEITNYVGRLTNREN